MKKYIFDASTLILLAKVTILKRFADQKDIVITPTVKQEVLKKKDAEDTLIICRLIGDARIKESTQKIRAEKLMADFILGAGEAETICFALKNKEIVATDDFRAVKACKALDIPFITAIHCLIYISKKKELDVSLALEKLKALEKYGRYNKEIIKNAKKQITGETND